MSDRFPFPAFPNGWFRACYADELAPGDVRRLHRLGRELVVFRDGSGRARVLDAYCPHLGAHLGVGGKVEGDALRCPFHGWLWDGEGHCVEIPYAKRIPPKARLRSWPVVERNGIVFLYHDADGRPPAYAIPELAEYGSPDWSPCEIRRWTVKSRWLDMNENAVDQVHFRYVHGTHTIPQTEVEQDGLVLRCRSRMKMGTPRGEVMGGIDTDDYGPGFQTVRVSGIADTLMINTATPIDEETTDVSFAYSVKRSAGDAHVGVGAALIRDLEKQMAQDIAIWENKRHHERPLLCDGDGPVGVYRRWMRQFFSESSR
ncbi:MAG TPA: Rieske 2Fe-2S domain-containing protein [Myxococcota bacterium]|nr:Rieske 2Fe-2S domain-containing protein [Myxococcota bacterium]